MNRLILLLAAGLAACGRPAAAPGREAAGGAMEMPTPRAAHGAVASRDGRVFLIGGCVLESCEAGADSATVDAYDPASDRFRRAGRLSDRRLSAATLQLGSGEILVAGGWAGSQVSALVELWDPRTGRSRRGPALAEARSDLAALRLPGGRVLLAGGYDGNGPSSAVDLFDPATGRLAPAGRLAVARSGAGAALLPDGRVLLAGGGIGPGARSPTAGAEIYDPGTGRSVATGPLAEARYKHATVALADGSILVLGGSDARDRGGKLSSVERYDPASGTFSPAGRLLDARYKIGAAALRLADGRVLVAGGAPRAELFDPSTGRSERFGPDLGRSLNFSTATLLADGSILVAGGYDENGIRMSRDAWRIRAGRR